MELMQISEQIVNYATLLVDIVKTDLEIVDNSLTRVAGFGTQVGDMPLMSDGLLYREAFTAGKFIIVQSPRRHPICTRCHSQYRCLVTMEIAFPLYYEMDTIGAIGIICNNLAQKNKIMEDIGAYLGFLRLISELIAKDLTDRESETSIRNSLNAYKYCFSVTPNCVIMLDGKNIIIDMNKNAQALFGDDFAGVELICCRLPDKIAVTVSGKIHSFLSVTEQAFSDSGLRILTFNNDKPIIPNTQTAEPVPAGIQAPLPVIRRLDDIEREEIERAIEVCGSDTNGKRRAAKLLGIGIATLYRKIND